MCFSTASVTERTVPVPVSVPGKRFRGVHYILALRVEISFCCKTRNKLHK